MCWFAIRSKIACTNIACQMYRLYNVYSYGAPLFFL